MRLINLLLAQVIFISSVAQAAEPAIRGTRYLMSCEGAMAAIEKGEGDRFLVSQAQTEAQALQLLRDYNMVFSNAFQEGIVLTLHDRGLKPLSETDIKLLGDSHGSYLEEVVLAALTPYRQAIEQVLNLSEAEFQKFCDQVIERTRGVRISGLSHLRAEVSGLMLKRLFEAIDQSPNRDSFYSVFRLLVRHALQKTQLYSVLREAQARKVSEPFWTGLKRSFSFLGLWEIGITTLTWSTERVGGEGWFWSTVLGGLMTWAGYYMAKQSAIADTEKQIGAAREAKGKFLSGYIFEGLAGESLEQELKDLFNQYEIVIEKTIESAESGAPGVAGVEDKVVLSLAQASELSSPNTLSPVQILYLGHLDILELEMTGKVLIAQLEGLTHGAGIRALRSRSEVILNGSKSFRDYALLAQAMQAYTLSYRELKSKAQESYTSLKGQIESVQSVLPKVKSLVFKFGKTIPSEAQLQQSELLWTKLNSDLKSLQSMGLRQDQVNSSVEHLEPSIEKLEAIFSAVESGQRDPHSPQVAEEVMLILDEMPQLAEGQGL